MRPEMRNSRSKTCQQQDRVGDSIYAFAISKVEAMTIVAYIEP